MRIVVYGSASKDTPQEFKDASFELGRLLAQRGHVCVNGGGNTGCMGALSDGCISGGGKVF
jgi:predicted Rossmann-fold nucleotide-binding protein